MTETDPFLGPLHLHGFLGECTEELMGVITGSVEHPVSHSFGLSCSCKPSVVTRVLDEASKSGDPRARQLAQERLARIEKHHMKRRTPSGFHPAVRQKSALMLPCRLFAIETNEEDGVVRGFCRRCPAVSPSGPCLRVAATSSTDVAD